MNRSPTRVVDSAISGIIRSAPPGSVLVLAALDCAQPFEGFCALKSDLGDSITILSIDEGLDYLLEKNGCRFVSLRRVLPAGAYTGIHLLAEEMAGRWNLLNGEDITEFEGVSYASLVQFEMSYFFARIMKSVVDAQAVVSAGLGGDFLVPVRLGLDPMVPFGHRDIVGDLPESFFAEALSYIGGDQVRVHRVTLGGASARQPARPRWRIRSSQVIQRWIIRAVLPWTRRRRLYVQDEYYLGQKLIRTLAASRRYRLIVDTQGGLMQCLRALRGQDPLRIPHAWFGRRAARAAMRRAALFFCGDSLDRVSSLQSNGSLRFRDVNLGPLVEGKLRYLFSRRFPELAAENAQIRAWLKATRICASVLVEDAMRWSRQVIATGRPMGMRSLCIQHGATGCRDIGQYLGFIPVTADITAVWGAISRTWMERAGVPALQLAVVGPPRFDCYAQAGRPPVPVKERETFCARIGIAPTDRLILYAETPAQPYLFPDVHYTFGNTRANLGILLVAMRRLPGFRLGIRLKYGAHDPYALLYRDLVDYQALDNVSFLPELPIEELLLHSEFTVTSFSGVAIEALYYDHPVIMVDSTGYHRVIPIVEYGAGILANSPEEFVEFVRSYDVDAGLREQLRRGREQLLNDYVGQRDGCASHRVLKLLDYLIIHGAAATRAAIKDGRLEDGRETGEDVKSGNQGIEGNR